MRVQAGSLPNVIYAGIPSTTRALIYVRKNSAPLKIGMNRPFPPPGATGARTPSHCLPTAAVESLAAI